MKSVKFHLQKIDELLKHLRISRGRALGLLVPYYVLTVLNSVLQGVGLVLLVNIFTSKSGVGENGLLRYVYSFIEKLGGETQLPGVIPLLIVLFIVNIVIRFSLLIFDGAMSGILRRDLQKEIFRRFLLGDWAHMRNFRVGDAIGTNTQEAMIVAKYLTSATAALYYLISAGVTLGMAVFASFKITVVLGLISLPLMWVMKKTFSIQAKYSKKSAALRNHFSADVADRLNGLLQVHVEGRYDYHLQQGVRSQEELTRMDILSGVCQAVIGSFNLLQPLTALVAFYFWLKFTGDHIPDLSLIASVGMLGVKVVSQLSGASASLGNLSRLSGSLYPVLEALATPLVRERKAIDEKIERIEVDHVAYAYGDNQVIDQASVLCEKGKPVVLSGRSGKGKTTLANLIAGLYFPSKGAVRYVTASGKSFASSEYEAKVGFVTQDIYLFRGSLKENLTSGLDLPEEKIWAVLKQVDAQEFVQKMGGLNTESAEAGRSLSGGQRRRLGIAKILLSGSEILILDEVTAGLDQTNKDAVMAVIEKLSRDYIVVMISHDSPSLPGQVFYTV